MSFLDCIKSAVEAGSIKPEKGVQAQAEWQAAYDKAIADGLSEDGAHAAAGIAAVDTVTKSTGDKRWQKINTIEKQHRLYRRLENMKDIRKESYDVMRDVNIAQDRNLGVAMSHIDALLDKYGTKGLGWRSIKNLDNVVEEAYAPGSTKDKAAESMAKSVKDLFEWLNKRANMEGASIHTNELWRLPQRFDRLKVRQFTREEFAARMESLGDWDVIKYNGKLVPEANRREVLMHMYDNIRGDGPKIEPGQSKGSANIATRLNEQRFFYYKDAKSYLASMKDFGAGNVYDQILGTIHIMSRDIAMMETFGPNSQSGFNFMKRMVEDQGRTLELASDGSKRKSVIKTRNETLSALDDQYKLLAGHVVGPEENLPALYANNAMGFVKAPLLSGVLLASFPDIAAVKSLSHAVAGLPTTGFMRSYVKNFLLNPKDFRQSAIRSGLIAHNLISMSHTYAKFHGPLEGSKWVQHWADFHSRIGLATHHNQVVQNAYGMEAMGEFAEQAKKKFDDTPFSTQMAARGITEADWDHFRAQAIHDPGGFHQLRPIDLINSIEGDAKHNIRVGEKFQDYLIWATHQSFPNPDVVIRQMRGDANSPATVAGVALRGIMTFRSYPLTIMTNQLGAIARLPTSGSSIKAFAKFALMMTLFGAASMQMKALKDGKDLYDPTDPTFWAASIANGGSFGLAGDMIYNSIKGGSLSKAIATPYGQALDATVRPLGDLFQSAKNKFGIGQFKETHATRDAVKLAATYGPQTWWLKLLMERYFYDTILQSGDPAAFAEKQRRVIQQSQDTGQQMWWAPGQAPRAPQVSHKPS